MSTSDSRPNANKTPNEVGAEESERRRTSELAGQRRAIEDADTKSDPDEVTDSTSRTASTDGLSNADQATENERRAEEDGRELPG
jgi:hypothetical protein